MSAKRQGSLGAIREAGYHGRHFLKKKFLLIYFGCTGSYLRHAGSLLWHVGFLVTACELLVAACMWDLVPRPGIEPGPPALGVQSLSHWTTREVPALLNIFHNRKFNLETD